MMTFLFAYFYIKNICNNHIISVYIYCVVPFISFYFGFMAEKLCIHGTEHSDAHTYSTRLHT